VAADESLLSRLARESFLGAAGAFPAAGFSPEQLELPQDQQDHVVLEQLAVAFADRWPSLETSTGVGFLRRSVSAFASSALLAHRSLSPF